MATTSVTLDVIEQVVDYVEGILPRGFIPKIGIIGGSGLSGLNEAFHGDKYEISYAEIKEAVKEFPITNVPGHIGKFVFGYVGETKTPAVLMNGRPHYYEGHDLQIATLPIRVLRLLGMETLIITNAAGGLNPELKVGDIVVIQDHVNWPGIAGANPLRGPNLDVFGPRFVPLCAPYDLALRRVAHQAWAAVTPGDWKAKMLHEGVYGFVAGPNYETRAECPMLARNGVNMVGMSTVPEVLIALHCGVRVLALSLITNDALMTPGLRGDDPVLEHLSDEQINQLTDRNTVNHEEVIVVSKASAEKLKSLIIKIIEIETSK